MLASDIEGPFEIVWKDTGASKKSMGKSFERAVNLLKELEVERDDFTFKLEYGDERTRRARRRSLTAQGCIAGGRLP